MAPLACAVLVSGSVFAEVDNEMRTSKIESQMRDAATTNARGTYGAKLADASPNIDGYGFYITTDAILYQLLEDNNTYAIGISSSTTPSGPRKTCQSTFDWSWGFKTGLGYYAEHDAWQSGFEFTYLETQTSSYAPVKAGTIYAESYSLGQSYDGIDDPFVSASDKWKVHYYNLDWTVGKDFFVSKYLSFLPQIGIKSAWFYQQKHNLFNQSVGASKRFDAQDNYTGVGPKADLKAKFYFGRNFSFIGGIDVALLFASNKTSYTGQSPTAASATSTYSLSNSLKKNHVSPYLGFNIGFAYDTNFMDDAFNFGIKLAYEQLYYNKASRLMTQDDPSYRDISFQGVDLGLEFSF